MKRYDIWLADLSPAFGVEIGGILPVVVVQTNILNVSHNSTVICPIAVQTTHNAQQIIVQLQKGDANLTQDSEILLTQMRAINNPRFIKQIGVLPPKYHAILDEKIKNLLDLT